MKPKKYMEPAAWRQALAVVTAGIALGATTATATATDYRAPEALCILADKNIDESSGLEFSSSGREVLWTHNDDEDDNRLFALGLDGETLGVHRLEGVEVKDWEDLSAFEKGGVRYLLCADVGNKDNVDRDGHLYFFEEPGKADEESHLRVLIAVSIRFKGGHPNCEAVAVDAKSAQILLATKTDDADESELYLLPLELTASDEPKVAQRIAALGIRKITSMDISKDGLRAVILADEELYEVERGETEAWHKAFRKRLRKVAELPKGQWEAICYGADDRTLYATSEKKSGSPLLVFRPSDSTGHSR